LIRAVRSVQRCKIKTAAIAAQHDVWAGDWVKNDFLTAIFGLADKAEDPSSRPSALLRLLHQSAQTERTADRDPLEALFEGMVR
jgi:hypothetical protein